VAATLTQDRSAEIRPPSSSIPVDLNVPLGVELDGSLIRSDSLAEGCMLVLRRRPLAFLKACCSLPKGRAAFKRGIAELAPIDPRLLPYRADVLDLLRTEYETGRRLILATAADESQRGRLPSISGSSTK
jgi:hypothetical protein